MFTFGGGGPMGFFGLNDLSQMMNGIGLAGNPGDYAWGNQFDQILHNLFHQSGPKGPPPADETAVRELPKEEIGPADVDAKEDCPVCKEEYKVGEQVMKLPCNHRFHIDCLQPWLKMRNTCPVCRYALPASGAVANSAAPPPATAANQRAAPAPSFISDVPSPPDLSDEDDEDSDNDRNPSSSKKKGGETSYDNMYL